jgi:hypothetical protein
MLESQVCDNMLHSVHDLVVLVESNLESMETGVGTTATAAAARIAPVAVVAKVQLLHGLCFS